MTRHQRAHDFPSLVGLSGLVGTLVLATGCTFEPPGSVLEVDEVSATDAGPGEQEEDPPAEADAGPAAAPESMSITFTTEETGGLYAPANVVATWIESPEGAFVKTIDRQALVRVNSLVAWNAMAGVDQDAVSGATRLNHNTPITAEWDIALESVPDGIYTIKIETSDNNPGLGINNIGTFTFEKNGTAAVQSNLTVPGYLDVTIDYSGRE